jgi:hypothetical protein
MRVASQADQGVPENVAWDSSGISFAAIHIVGSNNSLVPWTGNTTATPEQQVEVLSRTAADLELIRDTFGSARRGFRAVALMIQADMFDPTVTAPTFADYFAFQPIVAAIAREARSFQGPVYLFDGDSHVANQDQPLAPGSPWLAFYGIRDPAPNVTRVTVEGSTGVDEWLKVTIQPRGAQVLTFERVPFSTTAAAPAPAAAAAPTATSMPAN